MLIRGSQDHVTFPVVTHQLLQEVSYVMVMKELERRDSKQGPPRGTVQTKCSATTDHCFDRLPLPQGSDFGVRVCLIFPVTGPLTCKRWKARWMS